MLEGTTTKERRERKKNYYSLEVRDAGFIYPADHPKSGLVYQTTNMYNIYIGGYPIYPPRLSIKSINQKEVKNQFDLYSKSFIKSSI